MAISLKHSTLAVGADAGNGEIGKTEWNEDHALTLGTGKLLGRSTAGDGAAEEITVGSGLTLNAGTLTAAGTVGGSDAQLQFNDSGSFGGDAGLTFNKTTNALTIDDGTLNFNGSSSGTVTIQPAAAAGTYTLTLPTSDGDAGQFLKTDGSGVLSWDAAGGGGTPGGSDTQVQFNDGGSFGGDADFTWDKTNNVLTLGTDARLRRRGAANLALGNTDAAAPVAQTLSVQSVVAGTTNTAGANLTITGSQGTGTGAGGSIIFQVAPAGSSGTAQNALTSVLEILPDKSVLLSGFDGNWTQYLGLGTNQQLRIAGSGNIAICSNGGRFAVLGAVGFTTGSDKEIGWTNVTSWALNGATPTRDLVLARDAANTLAQRNGANAQAFRVYNTFTNATTFERANIFWDSNVLKIGTEKGSVGGTARALEFQTDGTTAVTLTTAQKAEFAATIKTGAPSGGTAAEWKLGTVATVSPSSPNRTIEVEIGGTTYYISAKTTND